MRPETIPIRSRQKFLWRSAVTVSLVSAFLCTAALAAIDARGKPRAIVEIDSSDGELHGKVVKLLNQPADAPPPVCDECEGPRHGKPVLGMTVLWGLAKDGDEWTDGKILDPESGDIYDASIQLSEDGQTLKVRGYLGISLLGRTQTWQRVSTTQGEDERQG